MINAILGGDFLHVGFRYCKKFTNLQNKQLNILFVSYALPNSDYNTAQKNALRKCFNVKKIVELTPDYDFKDKIDVIFVNGGYYLTSLVDKLVQSGHDKKIEQLVNSGVLYIGESTGALIAGNYSHRYLFEDTREEEVKLRFTGFKFINSVIIPHCSKYRFPKVLDGIHEQDMSVRVPNKTSKGLSPLYRNLKIIKQLKSLHEEYVALKENEVVVIKNGDYKILKYDWSKIPIVENSPNMYENKIANEINKDKRNA